MQTKSNINWKKLLQGVSLAAFVAAPVFGATIVSQAAPPDHAPAYGYRDHNRNDRDYNDYDDDRDNDDDDDDNDNDDNDSNDRDYYDHKYHDRNNHDRNDDNFYNSTRSLEGVVVSDLGGRDFVLRLKDGRNVRVQLNQREPQRLSQGDRVLVQGYFDQIDRDNGNNTSYNDNLVFRATDVRIIRDRNNGNNNNGRRTLNGIVTKVRSDRSFTFNALNRSFDVVSTSRLPRGFSRGNIVSVSGDVRNNNISNARVTLVRNGNNNSGNYNSGNFNKNVNFPATVLDSNERNGTLQVRGEDGRKYTVRTSEADKWSRGDRVRIQGRTQNGIVVAEDIDKR